MLSRALMCLSYISFLFRVRVRASQGFCAIQSPPSKTSTESHHITQFFKFSQLTQNSSLGLRWRCRREEFLFRFVVVRNCVMISRESSQTRLPLTRDSLVSSFFLDRDLSGNIQCQFRRNTVEKSKQLEVLIWRFSSQRASRAIKFFDSSMLLPFGPFHPPVRPQQSNIATIFNIVEVCD